MKSEMLAVPERAFFNNEDIKSKNTLFKMGKK